MCKHGGAGRGGKSLGSPRGCPSACPQPTGPRLFPQPPEASWPRIDPSAIHTSPVSSQAPCQAGG
eukprot:gene21740-biopygen5689